MDALEDLQNKISMLPGLGPKSARRIAYFLLKSDDEFNTSLGDSIKTIKTLIHPCPICGMFTDKEICSVCRDKSRDPSLLCVVEETQDVSIIEDSKIYRGYYHVLGGAISPIDGIYPQNLRFKELEERIEKGAFKEVIIATNPTDAGDTTAMYTKKLLSKFENLRFSRLAQGLQAGGDLEFANYRALSQSFKNRTDI